MPTGVGLWVPLPVGCGLKDSSVHWSDPGSLAPTWWGVSLYWPEGEREGELAFEAGALGRRYIDFDIREKFRKVLLNLLRVISFLCSSKKTSL